MERLYLTRLFPYQEPVLLTYEEWKWWYSTIYCKSSHFIIMVKEPCLEYWNYICCCNKRSAITAHHWPRGYLNLWHEDIKKDVIAVCNLCHATLHNKFKPFGRNPKTINGIQPTIDFEELKSRFSVKEKNIMKMVENEKIDSFSLGITAQNIGKKRDKIKAIN